MNYTPLMSSMTAPVSYDQTPVSFPPRPTISQRPMSAPLNVPRQSRVYVLQLEPNATSTLDGVCDSVVPLNDHSDLRLHLDCESATCLVLNADRLADGLGLICRQIRQFAIGLPVVALTADHSIPNVRRVLRCGVFDCCPIEVGYQQLTQSVSAAIAADGTGDPAPSEVRNRIASLTEREREVVEECLGGVMTKVIAKHLEVTYQTIDKHRKKALRKMGVGSMVELANLLSHTASAQFGFTYTFRAF